MLTDSAQLPPPTLVNQQWRDPFRVLWTPWVWFAKHILRTRDGGLGGALQMFSDLYNTRNAPRLGVLRARSKGKERAPVPPLPHCGVELERGKWISVARARRCGSAPACECELARLTAGAPSQERALLEEAGILAGEDDVEDRVPKTPLERVRVATLLRAHACISKARRRQSGPRPGEYCGCCTFPTRRAGSMQQSHGLGAHACGP